MALVFSRFLLTGGRPHRICQKIWQKVAVNISKLIVILLEVDRLLLPDFQVWGEFVHAKADYSDL